MELKGWIARDEHGELYLYDNFPMNGNITDYFILDKDFFPEVTWENSPVEVVIKIEKV